MDPEAKDIKQGGVAVVNLGGTLKELGLFVKVAPANIDIAVAEVVAAYFNIAHEVELRG